MLKFVVDRRREGKPVLLGLGLSFANLLRLRSDAIQFHASDVGLGAGVFVIAHADDPQLPHYKRRGGSEICDLVSLSQGECESLERDGEVLVCALRSKHQGQACEALVFAGPTEAALVEAMWRRGLVTDGAKIIEAGPAPARAEAVARPDADERDEPPADPAISARSADAIFAGRFVATLPGGARIVDLRGATDAELADLALFDAVTTELAAAGPSSGLFVWIVPGKALAAWTEDLVALMRRLGAFSIARTTTGDYVTNAFVVAGPHEPADALFHLLRSLGMSLLRMGSSDPAPVLEVALGDGRVVTGIDTTAVHSLEPG